MKTGLFIYLLTFLCTCVGMIYEVHTARRYNAAANKPVASWSISMAALVLFVSVFPPIAWWLTYTIWRRRVEMQLELELRFIRGDDDG